MATTGAASPPSSPALTGAGEDRVGGEVVAVGAGGDANRLDDDVEDRIRL